MRAKECLGDIGISKAGLNVFGGITVSILLSLRGYSAGRERRIGQMFMGV